MPQLETFKPIEWLESMATGITEIDEHHRYLIETLQDAHKRLLEDNDSALLKQLVNDLLGYAIMHFDTEERLMQSYNYEADFPEEAMNHIKEHRNFINRITAVHEQLRENQAVSKIELLTFLNTWLKDHVFGIDQLLGQFLVQKMK